jgi:hypothetical protein
MVAKGAAPSRAQHEAVDKKQSRRKDSGLLERLLGSHAYVILQISGCPLPRLSLFLNSDADGFSLLQILTSGSATRKASSWRQCAGVFATRISSSKFTNPAASFAGFRMVSTAFLFCMILHRGFLCLLYMSVVSCLRVCSRGRGSDPGVACSMLEKAVAALWALVSLPGKGGKRKARWRKNQRQSLVSFPSEEQRAS